MVKIRQNFIYPEIKSEARKYGASFFSRPIVKPDGDYRKNLPPEEEQRRYGVEPSTCFLFAQLHADATYEEAIFGEHDNNYAERFPAQFAGGTPYGGDPIRGADTIFDRGSIPEASMPFTDDVNSWEEYTSWKGVDMNKVIEEGKVDKTKKGRYGVVLFERNVPLASKYTLLEQGLQRGVPCISVWGVQEGDTYAMKPQGVSDTHMIEVTYVDKEKKQIHILDTYLPLQKILPANYNPDFAMVRYVEKKNTDQEKLTLIQLILQKINEALNLITQVFQKRIEDTSMDSPVINIIEPTTDFLHDFAKAIEQYEGFYKGSRSYRNNNSGNCRFSPIGYLPIYGEVKRDADNYAIFPTYELGFLYLKNLCKHKIEKNPTWNFVDFFHWFAPTEDNNKPLIYAGWVGKKVGRDPLTKLVDWV